MLFQIRLTHTAAREGWRELESSSRTAREREDTRVVPKIIDFAYFVARCMEGVCVCVCVCVNLITHVAVGFEMVRGGNGMIN